MATSRVIPNTAKVLMGYLQACACLADWRDSLVVDAVYSFKRDDFSECTYQCCRKVPAEFQKFPIVWVPKSGDLRSLRE